MKKGEKISVFTGALILCVFALICIPIQSTLLFDRLIARGVFINKEDVSLNTKAYAAERINKVYNSELQNKKITFKCGDVISTKTYGEFNIRYNVEDAVEQAFKAVKKDKDIYHRSIESFNYEKQEVPLEIVYDFKAIDEYIEKLSNQITKPPVDASMTLKNNKFEVTKEIKGIQLDGQKLKELIKDALANNKETVEIPVINIEPKVTAEILEKSTQRIASFTTNLTNNNDRSTNIKVAANFANGKLLMQGEVFSTNETIGDITLKRGFKMAPVYAQGKVRTGVGGGVCQFSTTLYNSVLLANLKILERYNHSMTVAYVNPGRDASISSGGADFKFRNTLNYPLYIQSFVEGKKLTVNLYSFNENPGQRVELFTEAVEIDGKTRYKTYRKVYNNNKLIKTEQLSNDYYLPHP